jgi:hypothetical protein
MDALAVEQELLPDAERLRSRPDGRWPRVAVFAGAPAHSPQVGPVARPADLRLEPQAAVLLVFLCER